LPTSRSRDEISHQFRKYADKIDLHKFKFHNLDDTYASWLVQQGTPLKVIQELLGHEDIKTTRIYAHIAPENKAIARDKINKMI
jgi:site-specific recombinase XerD